MASGAEHRTFSDVAYNSSRNEYLVVYDKLETNSNIFAVRLDGAGGILGGGEFHIAVWPDDEGLPRVASLNGADEWVIAWRSLQGGWHDLFARRIWVDGGGTVQYAAPVRITNTAPESEGIPALAAQAESSEYLVVWDLSSGQGVFGRKYQTTNGLSETLTISTTTVGNFKTGSAVATGPVGWFTVWEEQRSSPTWIDHPWSGRSSTDCLLMASRAEI